MTETGHSDSASPFASLEGLSIERTSTVDQVAAMLRQMILNGSLKPDAPLIEQALASVLDVSRNTVREATRALVAEGLVKRVMNQGARVASLDADDVRDLYAARRVFELAGIRSFSANDRVGLKSLEATIGQLRKSASQRDWTSMVDADMAFHLQIVNFVQSERIANFARAIQGELRLGLLLVTQGDEEAAPWIKDHETIFEALRAGDADSAARYLTTHLQLAEENLRGVVATSSTNREGTQIE